MSALPPYEVSQIDLTNIEPAVKALTAPVKAEPEALTEESFPIPPSSKPSLEKPPMTDEQISDMSDEVMHPEMGGRKVKFLNQTFTMIPLPISFSKRIGKLVRPVMQNVAKVAKMAEKDPEAAVRDNPLDDNAVEAMIQAVGITLQFYKLDNLIPIERVENEVTVETLYDLLMAQMELNGKNDFLLQPCRMLLSIVKASSMAESQMAEQV